MRGFLRRTALTVHKDGQAKHSSTQLQLDTSFDLHSSLDDWHCNASDGDDTAMLLALSNPAMASATPLSMRYLPTSSCKSIAWNLRRTYQAQLGEGVRLLPFMS